MGLMMLSVMPGTLTGRVGGWVGGGARTPRPDVTLGMHNYMQYTLGYAHAQRAHVSRCPGLLRACIAVDFCCPFFFSFSPSLGA